MHTTNTTQTHTTAHTHNIMIHTTNNSTMQNIQNTVITTQHISLSTMINALIGLTHNDMTNINIKQTIGCLIYVLYWLSINPILTMSMIWVC